MVHELALSITSFLLRKVEVEEEKDIYVYGLELIISGMLGAMLILLTGFIFHVQLYSIIFLAIIIPVRMYTGGYHADSRIVCDIVFVSSFISTVVITQYCLKNNYSEIVWIITLVSMLIICAYAPLENDNKPLTDTQKVKYKTISIIMYIIIISISAILDITGRVLYSNNSFYNKISLYINSILIIVAVLLLIGLGKEKILNEKSLSDNCKNGSKDS